MTDGVTVTLLSPSLLQKISAAADYPCQIALNRTLLGKFEKWSKLSSHVKAKLCIKKWHKTRPAFLFTSTFFDFLQFLSCNILDTFLLFLKSLYYTTRR
jgi:hypothetical protein